MLIDGVMLLWFILTALSVIFVAIDIRVDAGKSGDEMGLHPVHRLFGSVRRLFLCAGLPRAAAGAARTSLGPLAAGARLDHALRRRRRHRHSRRRSDRRRGLVSMVADFILEYVLGFTFRWTIFQAFSWTSLGRLQQSLRGTFLPNFCHELPDGRHDAGGGDRLRPTPEARDPTEPLFWFRLSLALMAGARSPFP